jgi:hypothetical protein
MVSVYIRRQDVRKSINFRPNVDAISFTRAVACVLHTYAAACAHGSSRYIRGLPRYVTELPFTKLLRLATQVQRLFILNMV